MQWSIVHRIFLNCEQFPNHLILIITYFLRLEMLSLSSLSSDWRLYTFLLDLLGVELSKTKPKLRTLYGERGERYFFLSPFRTNQLQFYNTYTPYVLLNTSAESSLLFNKVVETRRFVHDIPL